MNHKKKNKTLLTPMLTKQIQKETIIKLNNKSHEWIGLERGLQVQRAHAFLRNNQIKKVV